MQSDENHEIHSLVCTASSYSLSHNEIMSLPAAATGAVQKLQGFISELERSLEVNKQDAHLTIKDLLAENEVINTLLVHFSPCGSLAFY